MLNDDKREKKKYKMDDENDRSRQFSENTEVQINTANY